MTGYGSFYFSCDEIIVILFIVVLDKILFSESRRKTRVIHYLKLEKERLESFVFTEKLLHLAN